MDIAAKRKIIAILKVLQQHGDPLGSAAISRQLESWGIDLRERMVRYYLTLTDEAGLTQNLGRRGRVITDLGRRELDVGLAIDKVGFVAARVDELTYQMNFDENRLTGTVILNASVIAARDYDRIRELVLQVMVAGLGMGRHLLVVGPDQQIRGFEVPHGSLGLATVCSITLNGVLLRHGITMHSRFGGLLEIDNGEPARFSQIINYDASTLDPIEIFIKSGMTSVQKAARTGTGVIGASFREIPTVTLPDFQRISRRLDNIGLGCVLKIGKPNQPLLDIPVGHGRVGIIIAGGLNPLAAVEEAGIATTNRALHTLVDFSLLQDVGPELAGLPKQPAGTEVR